MSDIPDEVRDYLKKIAKKSGNKNKERGSEYFRELQKKSVEPRKKNKLSTRTNIDT